MYKKLCVFYFSGTGNALAASNWIADVFRDKEIPVEINRITPSLEIRTEDISENTLIGFCYPTHGFNAPPVVIDFCLRFPKVKNPVFLFNTRAGMKMYKLFTPGMSGLAQLLPALILRLKGLKIVGYQPMDLPSNWISMHPGIRQKVVDSIFERCERKTKKFAQKTLQGKKTYQGWLSLPIDLLISPVSVGYYLLGRFFLAKSFIADFNCNNCGKCIKECPVNAIVSKQNRPFWTRKCESCMHCMNSCPQKAIQTPHMFIIPLWWLVMFVIPVSIIRFLSTPGDFISQHFDLFIWLTLFIVSFPIIFFSYRILHFLMRFRFVSRLVSFTSLTKFKWWRRYFAPKKYLR